MGLFSKMKEPIFLKETSNAEYQIQKLMEIEPLLDEQGKSIIRQDIRYLEYGLDGEKNIAFELKNSHMPMYILHDIYLEYNGLSAQIDYLVFTRKICFVIECKNLYGNIEIDNSGNFIRTIEFGGKRKREGIYSPITQNQRHLELMKNIEFENQGNFITKLMVDKHFEDCNKSVIVLANPKTILDCKFAPKEIKRKVVRSDGLVKYIKDICAESKEKEKSDAGMLEWAQSYLNISKTINVDYTSKYEKYMIGGNNQKVNNDVSVKPQTESEEAVAGVELIEDTDIFKELKAYRLEVSRKENLKPYIIYNDKQLKELISRKPKSIEELQKVPGFGEVKSKKYGDDILRILAKY